ncbi:hypothetical protein EG329_003169 [Mollisiaceae sp. DMI_Dod_QoI]|nr:hypothetical protein EG329_003169 [Helotiales sp. DMI_Dod_QoI]
MGRNTRNVARPFPLLQGLGLKVVNIRGDGNCLFRALSDQIYGDQSRSTEIRAQVVEYMEKNPADFKPFIDVEAARGLRRNPKRKNTGAALVVDVPTEDQINQAWIQYLANMARNGTFADNLEIRAFAATYAVDVRVYQQTYTYFIKCGEDLHPGEERRIAHIALQYEHYSSVRNISGPDTGLPHVKPSDMEGLNAIQATSAKSDKATKIEKWMVDSVTSSVPYFVEESTIIQTLTANNGSVDDAVSHLLEPTSSPSTTPSTPSSSYSTNSGNSSVVRDEDSDDEEPQGPNKRQARKEKERLSKLKQDIEAELQAIPDLHISTVVV